MKNLSKFTIIILFIINAILYLYKADTPELRGDETTAYIALLPFFHQLSKGIFYPSFLAFYHEPFQLLSQIPVIFFGADEFWARLPNIVSGIAIFVVLFRLSKLLLKIDKYIILVLILFTINSSFLLYRLTLDYGLSVLFLTLFTFFLFKYDNLNNSRNDKLAVVTLFSAIMTFIDGLFVLPGLFIFSLKDAFLTRKVTKLIAFTGTVIGLWFLIVLASSLISGQFDWKLVAPARLFFRGSHYSLDGFIRNWEALSQYIHPSTLLLVLFALPFSLKNQTAKKLWTIFLLPLIFFNLVKSPTQHIYNFWPVLIILAVFGLKELIEHSRVIKFIITVILTVTVALNIQFIKFNLDNLQPSNYKITASFLRSRAPFCDKIFTNIDGYAFRFYFDRPYTKDPSSEFKFAVLETLKLEDKNIKPLVNFKTLAIIKSPGKTITIFENGYSGDIQYPKEISHVNFNFASTMDYISKCSK